MFQNDNTFYKILSKMPQKTYKEKQKTKIPYRCIETKS